MTVSTLSDDDSPQKGALHAKSVEKLREMIVSGDLRPGDRIRESHFCKAFGVSRTPIREAVRTLAAEGLIRISPNRSPVVADLAEVDLGHLYDVVATLEAMASEQACRVITQGELVEIIAIHGRMLESFERGERAEYLKLNFRIHQRTVEIAGNPVLHATWLALMPNMERARALANLDRARWLGAVTEHSKMLSALAARDGALLAALTRAHFRNGLKVSEKFLVPGAPAPL
ncbi:MAG: GntR family transcriptional regulator [Paracoccaceae bacterium]